MNFMSKKTQDNENSPITTIHFLPHGIRKNSWSICHKLFLNIHPKASLLFLKIIFMLGFYQQHTFLKRHRTHSMLSIQKLFQFQRNAEESGHNLGQPALGGPDWAGVFGPDDFQRSLPTSTILWFCDSHLEMTIFKNRKKANFMPCCNEAILR